MTLLYFMYIYLQTKSPLTVANKSISLIYFFNAGIISASATIFILSGEKCLKLTQWLSSTG